SNLPGNNDTIHLDNAVFTKLGAGALNAANFRLGAAAVDANDHVIYNRSTGVLSYDADGNGAGAAVQIALLSNKAALSSADFLVV
ncbi:calcium-binding protein, partial [Rhizobiaceae sp. 2RAB30]